MEIEIYHVDQAINGSKEALEANNIQRMICFIHYNHYICHCACSGGLKMLKTQSKTF